MRDLESVAKYLARLVAVTAVVVVMNERLAAQDPGRRRILVNIPAMTLELYEDDRLSKSYSVAVGKPSTPSPIGRFRIATKVKHPTWYGPDRIEGPGPRNPVGTRWIGLSIFGYGIHGTNAPGSIGSAASKGCIRMRNQDVEDLFGRVRAGDEVELVYDTIAGGKSLKDIYRREREPGLKPETAVAVAGGGQ